MVLVHMLDNQQYGKFYLGFVRNKGQLIMDNGVYERGEPLPINLMLTYARIFKPKEIVLPDMVYDKDKTIYLMNESLRSMSPDEIDDYSIMGVVQGKDKQDWIECFNWVNDNPKITTMGIHIKRLFSSPYWDSYEEGLDYIVTNKRKRVHILGLNTKALPYIIKYKQHLRSVDSKLPVKAGATGLNLKEKKSDYKMYSFDFNMEIPSPYMKIVKQNIKYLIEVLR